ncbi:MAG TPA: cyclic 2,3-diphosphoglycerate synthase [Chthoniobacterales bacterium]|jgi:predicted GTPase|nr:cyclic 2,3-diphosphoglycerate synthase [Chthoniobacterales bacterium]
MTTKILIMGAAGRDFHNFNVGFRDNRDCEVVAFTATQIPNIEDRRYPAALAGPLYPKGILIFPESELVDLIKKFSVDQVIFAYSDVSHETVMHKASIALAAGADFRLMGPKATLLKSSKPVVAICAVRTGSGKSQTSRAVADALKAMGRRLVVVRHPMPYGELAKQAVQRFETMDDLAQAHVTIEEREEYEPHLARGSIVYAGADYEKILRRAEKEADIIIWDGGNNDMPFFQPDLLFVVADPHRAGHELTFHPGETNLRMADVVVINKVDTASAENIARVRQNIRAVNPKAVIVEAESPISIDDADGEAMRGKRVLAVEDGPTLTHGDMSFGAGVLAARKFGASEIVDPRPYAVGSISETFARYPTTGAVLPAMGYGAKQIAELEATINATPADFVLIATPIDLRGIVKIKHPTMRVSYELAERGHPTVAEILRERFGN